MLERMRAHAQSWIAKLILGGIILSFALWGVADYFLGSRFEPVAEVDGQPIAPIEFAQAYERQKAALRAMLGGRFTDEDARRAGLARDTLETLINRRLILAEAEALGLVVPDAVIAATVRADPSFQSAGRFDPQRYRLVTRAMGFATPRDYEQSLKVDILAHQLQAALAGSAFVSEAELAARIIERHETRELAAVILDPDALPEPKITREEARAWYAAHKDRYRAPAKVKLAIVEIDPERIATDLSPSEDDLRRLYEASQARYRVPEARHLQHIFVRNAPDAKKKIERLAERLRNGEDFATLAKEASDDRTVDLGWVTRGTLDPAIERVAWSLKPGQTSAPVKTDRGWHLIRLVEARNERVRPFDEVRDDLARRWKDARARDEAGEQADALDDALGREDHLADAARAVGLTVRTIGPLPMAEAELDPALDDPRLRQIVAGAQPGDPIELVETDDGRFVAVEVLERIPPAVQPFDAVADRVIEDLARDKRAEAARKQAEALLEQADGQDARTLARKAGAAAYFTQPIDRSGAGERARWLTAPMIEAAFEAKPGAWLDRVFDTPLGVAVVRVVAVHRPSEAEIASAKEALRAELTKEKAAVRFARWMASVRDRHEIEIHEEALPRAAR